MGYGKAVLIGLDQLANAILGGWPDETLSSRCWRLSLAGRDWPRLVVDGLFFWDRDHCRNLTNPNAWGGNCRRN